MKPWENNIRRVEPYVPGEQPKDINIIKLNTNENPYPPAPAVYEEAGKIDMSMYRKYPDPACDILREALANNYGVTSDNVFVGVGSDDVLSMIFLTFFNSKKPILFPDITYSFYSVWAEVYGIPYERPALDENFNIRAEDYYTENGGVVIANPNAPTGIYRNLDFIRDILDHNQDVIVVVDEAYIDFSGNTSMLKELDKHPNLVVLQTFSKAWGMAGIRLGMAFTSTEIISLMNKVKYPYNVNLLTQAKALEQLEKYNRIEEWVKILLSERSRLMDMFSKLDICLQIYPSNANFFLAKVKNATAIYNYLVDNGIIVRNRSHISLCGNSLRITIGTPEENNTLIESLKNMPAL